MGLIVAVLCAVLVVVPLVVLAILAGGALGRAGQLSGKVAGVRSETDTLSSQLVTLKGALAGLRPRGRTDEQSHLVD